MKNSRSGYHPLRQLIIGGNPNSSQKHLNAYPPPLKKYLEDHGVNYKAYQEFTKTIQGQIVTPFSSEYAQARKESDNAFDKYPLLVVYCENSADVVHTIKFCRSENIQICARAGGHSTAGYSVLDGRLLIDVSRIKGIFIDPDAMTGTAGSGVQWGEFNYELDVYGLHTPGGGCSPVGITGFTLGGGYGYTSMRWGVASDNLLEVTMVTAEGEIVIANEKVNPDLYWAHRGGTGGNFGIVVALKYQLYRLKMVWPISVDWPVDDAAKILTVWQNKMTKTLEDTKLGLLGFLATRQIKKKLPSGETEVINQPYFTIRGIYSGASAADGAKALAPLLEIGTPSYPSGPLWKDQISYAYANEHLLDNTEGVIPDTIKETKRCSIINDPLTEEQYRKIVDFYKTAPSEFNLVSMEPYGGAINAVPPNATAYVHRKGHFDIFIDSFWLQDDEKAEAFQWLHDYFESEEMKGIWTEEYYQNYPNSLYKNWQQGYFGENYPKLRAVKSKWDPENVFHYEQSIEPLPEKKK